MRALPMLPAVSKRRTLVAVDAGSFSVLTVRATSSVPAAGDPPVQVPVAAMTRTHVRTPETVGRPLPKPSRSARVRRSLAVSALSQHDRCAAALARVFWVYPIAWHEPVVDVGPVRQVLVVLALTRHPGCPLFGAAFGVGVNPEHPDGPSARLNLSDATAHPPPIAKQLFRHSDSHCMITAMALSVLYIGADNCFHTDVRITKNCAGMVLRGRPKLALPVACRGGCACCRTRRRRPRSRRRRSSWCSCAG